MIRRSMPFLLVCLSASVSFSAETKPPNIILILADDLGINDLNCYGRDEHVTPNLNRLAGQGMKFNCAYTAQPICSPSRAALMTGKSPARLHLTNYLPGRADTPSQKLRQPKIEGQLPLEEVTLAELLRHHGYATGLFGKWHLGGKGFGPAEQGFDVVLDLVRDSTPSETEGGKSEYAITAAAEKFLEENKSHPFFCYVPHTNPHIKLNAKPELIEKHKEAFQPAYAAMIETLDDAVGRLMSKVDELGLTDNTIFIFTSDNGGLHILEQIDAVATINAPYRAGKGYLYEGGLREPLIIRWPGVVDPSSECDTPVVLTDLVPTLLEAAGLDPAKTVGPLDGVSFLPVLKGETPPPRPLFWHFPNYTNQGGRPAGSIRDGDWKLIENFEDNSLELFDLSQDLAEENNLAAKEPERATELLQKLRDWRERVGAQMLTPNPEFDPALHQQLYGNLDSTKFVANSSMPEPAWLAWRKLMNQVTRDRKQRLTPASGDIRLHAKDARVHGTTLRYEPEPHKNVLGYWTHAEDWADWEFDVPQPGTYEVEIQQGCGKGCGGSKVNIEVAGQTLEFTVQDTGHFQHMILRTIGVVNLPAGKATLAVKPQTKPGPAVMDVRRVVLRPAD